MIHREVDMDVFKPLAIFGGTQDELKQALLEQVHSQDPFPLARVDQYKGTPGVYILYYNGSFEAYQPIASNLDTPIYVGKTKDLDNRLRSHCRTLDQVFNLDRSDFHTRVIPLPNLWTELVEKVLINAYQPWWNQPNFAGFGNDGSPRASGKASRWEMLHPGRRRSLRKARPPDAQQMLQQACDRAAFLGGQANGVLDLFRTDDETLHDENMDFLNMFMV